MAEITKEDVEQLRIAARILSRPGEVEIAKETAASIEEILGRVAEQERQKAHLAKLEKKQAIIYRFKDAFRQAVLHPTYERHIIHLVHALEEWIELDDSR